MADQYIIGPATAQIHLSIRIQSDSPAATQVIVINEQDENDSGSEIADSVDASGEIEKSLDTSQITLKERTLSAVAVIGILGTDPQERKKSADRISGIFKISGGLSGNAEFISFKTCDDAFTEIKLIWNIPLV